MNGAMVEQHDDLREFMIVLRRALKLILQYIEKKYNLS